MSGVGVPVCSPDSEAPEKLLANSEHICMLETLPIAAGVEGRVGYDPGVEGPQRVVKGQWKSESDCVISKSVLFKGFNLVSSSSQQWGDQRGVSKEVMSDLVFRP